MNNKDRAVEFIDYLWNNGDESVLGTYLAADFKMHRPPYWTGMVATGKHFENGFAMW